MYIYGLVDPRNLELRYIGATNNIKKRLWWHLNDKHESHKSNWIKSLRSLGFKPDVIVIEETTESDWQDRERFWIAHHRSVGTKLTNMTDGGDGIPNPSAEIRAKMSAKVSGKNHPNFGKHLLAETRAKIGLANSTKRPSAEARQKMRQAHIGKTLSPESRSKLSAAISGNNHYLYGKHHNEKTIEKYRQQRSGAYSPRYGTKHTPETIAKMSAALKLRWESRKAEAKLSGKTISNKKLTWDDVNKIRELNRNGVPRWKIAELFGVGRTNIGCIVRNETWVSE